MVGKQWLVFSGWWLGERVVLALKLSPPDVILFDHLALQRLRGHDPRMGTGSAFESVYADAGILN